MRKIPLADQLKLLLNGKTTKIGAVLLLFCLLFSMVSLDSNDIKSIYFIGEKSPTLANVTAVIPQQESVRVLYQYTVEEKVYSGDFYTTDNVYQTGNYIEIEYAQLKPKHSRLLNEELGISLISTGIVFLIGLLLVLMDLKKNVETWVLMNWGEMTRGHLASKEKTKSGAEVFTFHYKDSEGRVHELIERTTDLQGVYFQISEPIIYLPKRPKMALLVSKLPEDVIL